MPNPLPWLLLTLCLIGPSHQFTQYDPETCQIIGDADLYGIGIRIGFYLAYFSGLLAIGFQNWGAVHDARKGVYTVNTAILVAMIRDSTQTGNLAAFEWYLLLQIAVFVPTSLTFVMADDKPVTVGLCILVDGTYAMLQPWVYWTLLSEGWSSTCPSPKVYIFAEIDFYDPRFTAFLKAMSVISCVLGVMLILWSWSLLAFSLPPFKKRHPTWVKWLMDPDQDLYTLSWENSWFVVGLLFFGLCIIGLTEKTLAINNISIPGTTVTSTGQLIPLLVGILTTMSTLYSIVNSPLPWTKEFKLRHQSSVAAVAEDQEATHEGAHSVVDEAKSSGV